MQGEVADTVLAALARLPLSLRVPVVLRYYADLSERDIALAIGRRQGTVKSRLHEARRRLAADPALSCPRRPRGLPTVRGDRTMTMLDDDQLATLLARAAADFELPESGAADIVARARRGRGEGEGEGRGDSVAAEAGADAGAPAPVAGGSPAPGRRAAARHRVLRWPPASSSFWRRRASWAPSAGARRARRPPRACATVAHRDPARAGSSPVTTTVPPFGAHHGGSSSGVAAAPSQQRPGPTQRAPLPSTTVPGQGAVALPDGAVGQPARIEQTGSLGLTVKAGRLNRTMTQLSAIAAGVGGFVASSQTQTGAGSAGPPSGTITLQVPVADFASVLKQAQALGKTSNLTTKATDVTGQYVDLQARIDALEASRQQYLTIMAKATTIGDVLSVQEQLDSLQSQIEQLQGQLQLLTSQTAYSTVTFTVNEPPPPPRIGPAPESGVVKSWHDSVGGFADGVEGIIRYAGPVLFTLLCLALVWLGGRALWRRYQRHNL